MKICNNSWLFWFRIMDLRSKTTFLTALIFSLTLNSRCNVNAATASSSSSSGSTTNNPENEYLNCTQNGVDKKVNIKGAGFPNEFPFGNKKSPFINCLDMDDKISCDLNVVCKGGESGKKENGVYLLSNKFLTTCKLATIVNQMKSDNTNAPNVFIVYLEDGKLRDDMKNDLNSFFSQSTPQTVKGFLPEAQNSQLQEVIQWTKQWNVTCDMNSLTDEQSSSSQDSILNNFSRTSVLFVSVSFIILMVISLAWLVFYYVQRFRYAHAKDRLARRLFNAAKKALTKIPAKTLRQGDRELDSDCPVCIEPYHASDVIRILPCKHVFHKTCVDPWLLEHRTCPMCKMDILKAFGYNFGHSEESVRDADQLSAGGQSTDGRGVGFPVPLPTDSDLHDPFFPSPAPSPSLLQPVLHSSNAQSFSIIPLTVHNSGARGSDSSADSSEHWVSERHSAEVHRGPLGDNSSAASSSGSEDGHELRGVTQPLFRPSRPSSSAIVVRSSKSNGKNRRKSTKSVTNGVLNSTSSTKPSASAAVVDVVNLKNIHRPRSASSQNLGSSIVDPPIPDGRISCGLRNETAPSLESL